MGTYRHGPRSRARDRAWVGMSLAALAVLGAMVAGASGGAAGEVRLGADQQQGAPGSWSEAARLPVPVTNNAVAAVSVKGGDFIFSFSGLDSTRTHSGIHSRAFRYDAARDEWSEVRGPAVGRIAATAQAVRGKIYLFGGYTVAADGSEKTLPSVDIYDPLHDSWSAGASIPVPVDDAVSGVWNDSLIYLISGWHDRDNVRNVQVYDPFSDTWRQATPIPGPRVFGHSGAIVGNTIVYVDGVRRMPTRPRYRITDAAYVGEIDPEDPGKIEWRELPSHPGPPLYRMAAAATESRVIFAGGTANPYNYDGVGYDGEPSEPVRTVFAYYVESGRWEALPAKPLASMDHRGFAVGGGRLYIPGGMLEGQRVTSRVQVLELEAN